MPSPTWVFYRNERFSLSLGFLVFTNLMILMMQNKTEKGKLIRLACLSHFAHGDGDEILTLVTLTLSSTEALGEFAFVSER